MALEVIRKPAAEQTNRQTYYHTMHQLVRSTVVTHTHTHARRYIAWMVDFNRDREVDGWKYLRK